MPNYCNNVATFKHSNAAAITAIETATQEGKLFQTLCPVNYDQASLDDNSNLLKINQQVSKWSTKWDIIDAHIDDISETHITISFDTAWCPPLAFYDHCLTLGYEVDAMYCEMGMQFVGHYVDGSDSEFPFDNDNVDNVPNYLVEQFGLEVIEYADE
jgi:hypothetical protein